MNERSHIAAEAARIICEDAVVDYKTAKQRALQRLGSSPRHRLPDNRRIEQAVLEYQALFGGQAYRRRLLAMRQTALKAMSLLADFQPRLAGALVSGAIGNAHRVQIQLSTDQAEQIDFLLHERRIAFRQDERSYRLAGLGEQRTPIARFEAGDIGIDVAIFSADIDRHPPLSQIDGKPAKRLSATQLQALIESQR
ncbi:MAG: hypothetical protein ACPGZP_02335 [Panacagrimonas sp.]